MSHDSDVERAPAPEGIKQQHAELYAEALAKYGVEGELDPKAEKRLKRKLDRRILPVLGICYFFYVRCVGLGETDELSMSTRRRCRTLPSLVSGCF